MPITNEPNTGPAVTRYACKFCICLYGLKGSQVLGLPATETDALQHVTMMHGYPRVSAQAILGESESARAAAHVIEATGPVVRVTYLPDLPTAAIVVTGPAGE